ncbi:uncharacterized protein LOC141686452 [Apium graveolens]|uniref:uncharacterized protein LOC141686452 n=1 Tax=Apium graveolens TaxID=4045 RepID=UPI003D7BFBFC
MFTVEAQGRSGGLTLLWKDQIQVNLQSMSINHIDVVISIPDMQTWRMTGFYGEPNRNHRRRTWELLRNLSRENNLPWCTIGDMNNILQQEDKRGGMSSPQWLLDGFSDTIEEAGLNDLELHGHQFTWERGRGTENWVEIRLDRALASSSWLELFPYAKLYNLEGSPSDHSAIFLDTTHKVSELRRKRDDLSIKEYKEVKHQLFLILDQKEILWRQRSKQFWLNAGDKNTKYFHATCNKRRRLNQIVKLKDESGKWFDWQNGLQALIESFYRDLFTAGQVELEGVIDCVSQSIYEEQNNSLKTELTREEVRRVLFQMHPDKAPGSDGMTPAFYQRHWHIVGEDIYILIKNIFDTGKISEGLNDTNIILIAKKTSPSMLGGLRPIALCNVVMKIVTKIMHYLKGKKTGNNGFMALKLDMSKAYDQIEWDFLRAIMLKMGFSRWWVQLVLQCVTKVVYSITHGEQVMGPIIPTRGLRQGDPLSPYLFIICAEGLSSLLRKYEHNKWIHGVKVCKKAPVINHMLFADDSYLFCKADPEEAMRVRELLEIYEKASGQQVNKGKSSIFYSSNVLHYNRQPICGTLQMIEANEHSTYFGLPNIIGRNKSAILGYLKNKVNMMIHSWDGYFVSRAGKEILVNQVAQALPVYAMNVFLLPQDITNSIEKCLTKYWWISGQSNNSKVVWMNWDRLSKHKRAGGMGFRNFRDFNIAMLGKQLWRLATNTQSLVSRLYKARYYDKSDVLHAGLGHNPSFIWRSLMEAQQVLKDGVRWRVDKLEWDVEVISDIFNNRDKENILAIPLSTADQNDQLYWKFEAFGSPFIEAPDFRTWLISVFDMVDKSKFAEIVSLCWSLWRTRNDLVWNQKQTRIYRTVAAARQYLVQWITTQYRSFTTPLQPKVNGDGASAWVKPQPNKLKITVDAAIFDDHGGVGFGLVARDSEGQLREAKAIFQRGLHSPVEAEAMAFKEALSWMDRRGWHDFIVESDCLTVVQAVRSSVPMRSYIGRIIEECMRVLQRLNKIDLFFVKRSANMVAHQLDRESYFLSDRTFDRSNIPCSIQNCIESDLIA